MAWTKAKTAVVAAVGILLVLGGSIKLGTHFHHKLSMSKLPTGNVTPMVGFGYSWHGIFLASDGSLWSWGEQRLGWPVLGLINVENTISLRRIGTETNWASIAVGDSHNLAIKSDGTLWAWGANFACQLGDGTKTPRPTPIPSVPGNDWKQVAAGGAHSYGLKKNGTLWGWGNNSSGELGIGDNQKCTNAVQIGSSTNWTRIWSGGIQTVGLQSDGSLWFWGSLTGDNAENHKVIVPTQVSADTNWVDVCFGYFTMFAIKSDGTLWSWGNQARFYTQVMDADSNATPLQVGKETDWQSCSSMVGGLYQLLRKKDGTLWAMDAADHRQVKADPEYRPVAFRKITLDKDIVAYTSGADNLGLVMTREGEVWTWGKVFGEHSSKDLFAPNGEILRPQYKTIDVPRQLPIGGTRQLDNWEPWKRIQRAN